jgi:hypothetical protein
MTDTALRILALCIALASAETLHGIARAALLVPRVGKAKALKISIVTGSLLAFGVCWVFVPEIGLQETGELLALGLLLAGFMASFDIALGKLVLRLPWTKVLREFDPRSGNYLVFGLGGLVFWPWLVMRLLGVAGSIG